MSLTVLSHSQALATKRFSLVDGKTHVEAYGKGKFFSGRVVPVNDIVSLATAVHELASDSSSFVVRGEAVGDLSRIRRTVNAQQGDPAGFREVPRQWVMLDVDGAPGAVDLSTPEGCERAAGTALERLPDYVRAAACYWQLSSSAGMKPGVSVHFWYWLDRPMGQQELTAWADHLADEAGRKVVDPAVFRTVQPNYTADPVFDIGTHDPVAQRCGFREGAPALSLPDVRAPLQGTAWKKKLSPLYDITNTEVHPHVRSACASFFLSAGPEASDAPLVQAIREAVDYSCSLRGVATSYSPEKVKEYVASGREYAKRKQGATLSRDAQGEVRPTPANIRAILVASPEWDGVLGFDERKDRPVFRKEPPFSDGNRGNRTGPAPRDYTDEDDSRIMTWLAETHAVQVTPAQVASVINSIAKEHSFDPVQDYLRGLAWDGEGRVDSWLIDYAGVADTRYTRLVGALWLISAVARALGPGCKVDTMLVLEGPQGAGKSSLLRELAGGLTYFREGIGDIRNVETLKEIRQAWIVEVRELGGFRRAENAAKKSFIDRQNDHFRGSYDRRPTDHLRGCVFAATTNEEDYLHDASGARRYLPVRVGEIDLEALREVRDQLWAEAVYRYNAGEPWHVDADDPDFVAEQRERSFDDRDDPWIEKIAAALERGVSSHLPSPVTERIAPKADTVRLLQVLENVFNLAAPTQADNARVARALRILGWQRGRTSKFATWTRRNLTVVAEAC